MPALLLDGKFNCAPEGGCKFEAYRSFPRALPALLPTASNGRDEDLDSRVSRSRKPFCGRIESFGYSASIGEGLVFEVPLLRLELASFAFDI